MVTHFEEAFCNLIIVAFIQYVAVERCGNRYFLRGNRRRGIDVAVSYLDISSACVFGISSVAVGYVACRIIGNAVIVVLIFDVSVAVDVFVFNAVAVEIISDSVFVVIAYFLAEVEQFVIETAGNVIISVIVFIIYVLVDIVLCIESRIACNDILSVVDVDITRSDRTVDTALVRTVDKDVSVQCFVVVIFAGKLAHVDGLEHLKDVAVSRGIAYLVKVEDIVAEFTLIDAESQIEHVKHVAYIAERREEQSEYDREEALGQNKFDCGVGYNEFNDSVRSP